jgi:hypothetical protein
VGPYQRIRNTKNKKQKKTKNKKQKTKNKKQKTKNKKQKTKNKKQLITNPVPTSPKYSTSKIALFLPYKSITFTADSSKRAREIRTFCL